MSILDDLRRSRVNHDQISNDIIGRCEADGGRNLTDPEAATIRESRAAKVAIDQRIADLEASDRRDAAAANVRAGMTNGGAATSRAVISSEARTYSKDASFDGTQRSFFQDAWTAREFGDSAAQGRLARHAREVEVEREFRATTTGSFAGLVVPQYLVEQAALVARAGRPVANSVQHLPLPAEGTSFNIPRGTTGVTAASQTPENTNVSNTDEVFTNLTLSVVTIAGQQDVSRQSLERGTPGIDSLVYLDLAAAYAAELDRQVINGSGASGQHLGILGTATINAATAFGAAVTAANFYTKVAGQVQQVSATRFLPPDVIFMAPRRFGWLTAQSDSSGRPLVVPVGNGPNNAQGSYDHAATGGVVGTMLGLPIVADPNIPLTIGAASGGEDVVIVARSKDLLLFEDGDGMPRQLRFEQTLGNQLTVKLVSYGYSAFTAGRYPKAVGTVGGLDTTTNGLVTPTF